jgi:hypothetical protein
MSTKMKVAYAATVLMVLNLGCSKSRPPVAQAQTQSPCAAQKLLKIAEADQKAFGEYTTASANEGGLVRLAVRNESRSEEAAQIREKGAYFSFACLTQEYGRSTDLELTRDGARELIFQTGFAGADYGFMTVVPGVSLSDVTTETREVQYALNYSPRSIESEARVEYYAFRKGRLIDGITYESQLAMEVGTTYVLRSINFNGTDVLVAFQVLQTFEDGGVLIAWKLLRNYSAPALN